MSKEIKKLAHHSLIYGIGSSLGAVGSFLLLPLYTHALSTQDYGAMELLYRLCNVLMIVMFLGVRQAYIRFFFDNRGDKGWQETVTGSTMVFVAISCAAILLLFLPFENLVLEKLLGGHVTDVVLLLALFWIPCDMFLNVGLTYFQIQLRSLAYVLINVAFMILYLGANVVLVYWMRLGVKGVFLAQIGVTGSIALGVIVYIAATNRLRVSVDLIRKMIVFGLPLLPASFFMYLINNADRYFLSVYSGLQDVGIYALAAKLGTVGTLFLMEPFLKVWSPFLFENYDKPDGPALVSRVLTLFTLACVLVALGVSVFAPIVLPYVTGKEFMGAFALVPLACLAAVFYSISGLVDAGILIAKKTQYKPLIFGIAAAVSVIANVILVPLFGIWGAAIAAVVAMITLTLVNLHYSNRFYRLPIEWRRIALIFAGAVITYLLCDFIFIWSDHSIPGQIGSVLALASFPLLLWWSKFFTVGELKAIRGAGRKAE
jgi:O-antigen/teichoic acid export membrane protein